MSVSMHMVGDQMYVKSSRPVYYKCSKYVQTRSIKKDTIELQINNIKIVYMLSMAVFYNRQ